MDVYLGHDFTIVEKGDPFYPHPGRSYIIMTTPKAAQDLPTPTDICHVGSKVVVYINKQPCQ